MPTFILSDQMIQPYSEFITGVLQQLADNNVNKIAFVGIGQNGEAITGYYGMDTMDIATAAMHIKFDAVDHFILANIERYKKTTEDFDDGFYESG